MNKDYNLKKTYWFYVWSNKAKKIYVFQDTLMNVLIAVANTNFETDGWSDDAEECGEFFDNQQSEQFEDEYIENQDPRYNNYYSDVHAYNYEPPSIDEVMDPLSDEEVADEMAYELTHNDASDEFKDIFQWEDVVPAWGDTKEKAREMMEEIWNDVDDETIVEKNPIKNQRIDENKNMTKITKQELNQMIKEEVRKQTSRNRRKLFENNNEDFEIDGTTLVNYKGSDSNVTIPDGITKIGDMAVDNRYGLKSITIPNSVKKIDKYAFFDCRNLTSITIPNSVTYIGMNAFNGCRNLVSITIPNSVKEIGGEVFRDCTSLKSIKIPNSVERIGFSAFDGCSSLTLIKIPDNVKSIGGWAFEDCINLTSITIPNSVTHIGMYAFKNCNNLTDIKIPERFKDDDTLDDIGFNDKQIDIILNKK